MRAITVCLGAAALAAALGMAGRALAEEIYCGEARDWTTVSFVERGQFRSCIASITRDGVTWGMEMQADGLWQIVLAVPGLYGATDVELDISRASMPATPAYADGANLFIPVDWTVIDAVQAGSYMTITEAGGISATVSLAGSAAAAGKIDECVARRGVAPRSAPARAPAPAPKAAVVENDALRPGYNCVDFRAVHTGPGSSDPTTIRFINEAGRALTVYWLDYDGIPQEMAALLPGESADLNSYEGHLFVARDFDGTCVGGLLEAFSGFSEYALR
jgi:hypothetical protein